MDNQHRKITGYRELTQEDLDNMNAIKNVGKDLGLMIEQMRLDTTRDQRWVSIGATHLQEGLMALTRAVAKPEFF